MLNKGVTKMCEDIHEYRLWIFFTVVCITIRLIAASMATSLLETPMSSSTSMGMTRVLSTSG